MGGTRCQRLLPRAGVSERRPISEHGFLRSVAPATPPGHMRLCRSHAGGASEAWARGRRGAWGAHPDSSFAAGSLSELRARLRLPRRSVPPLGKGSCAPCPSSGRPDAARAAPAAPTPPRPSSDAVPTAAGSSAAKIGQGRGAASGRLTSLPKLLGPDTFSLPKHIEDTRGRWLPARGSPGRERPERGAEAGDAPLPALPEGLLHKLGF